METVSTAEKHSECKSLDIKRSDIRVHRGGSAAVQYAVAETQGGRDSFEDAHAVHCGKKSADFWLLDGHCGSAAARWAAPALSEEVGALTKDGRLPRDEKIRKGFRAVDAKLRKMLERRRSERNAGTTVTGALLTMQPDGTYTAKLANCGDSRAIVVRSPAETRSEGGELAPVICRLPHQPEDGGKDEHKSERKEKKSEHKEKKEHKDKYLKQRRGEKQAWPAILETQDHKPCVPSERARIEAAGGRVDEERVDGRLAVSRGLGDFGFKADPKRGASEQKVSCIPDIYEISNLLPGALVILGCDGLWDVVPSETAAQFAHLCLSGGGPCKNVGEVAAALVRAALRRGSTDNVTVMVAQLTDGKSWENTPAEQASLVGFSP